MVTKDNTILITGGGAGIGLALVRELYYEGNNIIVTGRKEETLNAVKNEFPNISTLQCDLMNPRDVNNLLDTCKKAFKPINVFIGNAGIQQMFYLQNLRTKEPNRPYANEAGEISPLHLIYGLVPLIKKNRNPAIILICHGQKISERNSPIDYRATEKATNNLARWLRSQLSNQGIEVFQIVPPLSDAQLKKGSFKSAISEETIAKRFIVDARKGRYESDIGQSLLFKAINRLSPAVSKFFWKTTNI